MELIKIETGERIRISVKGVTKHGKIVPPPADTVMTAEVTAGDVTTAVEEDQKSAFVNAGVAGNSEVKFSAKSESANLMKEETDPVEVVDAPVVELVFQGEEASSNNQG